jgi:hypothetical protein
VYHPESERSVTETPALCSSLHRAACLALIALACIMCRPVAAAESLVAQDFTVNGETWEIRLPRGLRLELLTDRLDGPRLMHFLPGGTLLIGSKSGHVYRLNPPYDRPEVLVELDDYPHSVTWRDGTLWIAQTGGVYRAPWKPGEAVIDPQQVERVTDLPQGGSHSSRTIITGPDGRIYVALGISGNCSDEYLDDSYPFQDRRGGVFVLDESGDQARLVPFA